MIETKPKKQAERALLIGLEQDGVSKWDLRDSMEELRELANSAGAEVVDTVTCRSCRGRLRHFTSAKEKRRRSRSRCKASE